MIYPFTQEDAQQAYDEWGANCGPGALAFALQIHLAQVRGKIPGFESKRYTSPTMMKAGLAAMGKVFEVIPADQLPYGQFNERPALVRVQWTGPWTAPEANPRWAYRQTHWICTFMQLESHAPDHWTVATKVFDINGGIMDWKTWCETIVPQLTALYPRADGKFTVTHCWRIK